MSAAERAGYVFGAAEDGVRGKAGTPGFWAPEMLMQERDGKGRRYGPAVDWWSFGCLVYALLTSRGPFTVLGGTTADDNIATLTSEPDLAWAPFSPAATSLLRALLNKDPAARLGCGADGVAELQRHPFFAGIDWLALERKAVAPPFKPTLNVLQSRRAVRGWSDRDRDKLATVAVAATDHVRYCVHTHVCLHLGGGHR